MDRRIFDSAEAYQMALSKQNAEKTNCINDDYCVMTPINRNNGILTMAFVDMQPLDNVYEIDEAFKFGTLFPNLNKPFYGGMTR